MDIVCITAIIIVFSLGVAFGILVHRLFPSGALIVRKFNDRADLFLELYDELNNVCEKKCITLEINCSQK